MRFSIGWFICTVIVNIVGCVLLPILAFGIGMSAFNSPSNQVKFNLFILEVIAWMWSTGSMIALKVFGITFGKGLLGIAFIWAIILGVIFGFLIPLIISRCKDAPLRYEAPPRDKW